MAHWILRERRQHGEWFDVTPDTAAEAVQEAARLVTSGQREPPAPRERLGAIRFSVTEELWTELHHKALDERVTVKYLVLRALARDGFSVDLDAIPEDGRRLR